MLRSSSQTPDLLKKILTFKCSWVSFRNAWEPHKDAKCYFQQILERATHKTSALWPLTSHHTKHPNKTKKTCWRSKDKLQSNILIEIPTHGHCNVGRPAKKKKNITFINSEWIGNVIKGIDRDGCRKRTKGKTVHFRKPVEWIGWEVVLTFSKTQRKDSVVWRRKKC